jgi:hypothetical protein
MEQAMKIFPAPFKGDDRFFFNLSGNVGPNSLNKQEDVQLVQFGYFAMAQIMLPGTAVETLEAAAKVVPGADYKGAADDPLTIAIKTDQKFRGGTQDGHVSRVHGEIFYDGVHAFQLVSLVNSIKRMMPSEFPRLDKHQKCPAILAAAVKAMFLVPGTF